VEDWRWLRTPLTRPDSLYLAAFLRMA